MSRLPLVLTTTALIGLSLPALAQNPDFHATYHVERTPAAQLTIETCGEAVAQAARSSGLEIKSENYPAQLVTLMGGKEGTGSFIVQCITVGETTVSVVQGIDYRASKGAMGRFADDAFAAVQKAAR